jgi:hypothetical protein
MAVLPVLPDGMFPAFIFSGSSPARAVFWLRDRANDVPKQFANF